MEHVEPTKLSPKTRFTFKCHKGIKCFTKCCSKINILLTPYDIIRMKKRVGMSSEKFLDTYTYMDVDEKTSYPFVRIKMNEDEERACPFVTPEGCSIYTDRPANCRYYPIGQTSLRKGGENGPVHEEFFFFIREPHCLGYQEDTEWTVEQWRKDQEVALYDDMNREWKEILLQKNPFGTKLDSNRQAQIYTASYDLDRFRRFIFESKFFDVFDIDREEMEKIKADDLALMKFSMKYLKYILMIDQALQTRENHQQGNDKVNP